MAILTKTILVLEDGKISAFDFQNRETYIQPEIIVNTLDAISQVTIQGQFKESITIDVSIQSIDGVVFAGNFTQLETALRLAALKANGLAVGGGGGGGGGDASAANQLLEIAELQTLVANTGASEVTAFVTTANLPDTGVFDSGILDMEGKTQVQTEINSSNDGLINITFYSDAAGTDAVRTLAIPYVAANGFQFFAAPAFVNYVKYEFTNNSGSAQTDFYYTTKFLTTSLSPQILTTSAFIADAMVTQLVRSIIVGVDGQTGDYKNVSTTTTTNDHGDHINLNVVSGARPSELAGRVAVKILADNATAPTLLYTVTPLKTLYITDILLTIVNEGTMTGRLEIYDALTAVGIPALPINAADPGSGGDSTLTTVTMSFIEPLEFTTGVYFDEAASTLIMSGIMNGYEE